MNPDRVKTADVLRGVAALAVAWFHFTNGNQTFLHAGFLKTSGSYGWLGIEMFFVISGFVIPYTLHRARFEMRGYGRFLLRRVIRLDPPYLVTIAIIIGLDFVSSATPGFRGQPFDFSWPRFLAHLGYLNAFVGYAWYNPVFWSLAIEFQWYLLSGLLFMAFSHTSRAVRWGTFSAFGLLPFLMPADGLVFRYLPLFSFGIATYQLRTGLLAKLEYFVICAVCTFLCVLNMTVAIAAVGLVTALMIAFLDIGRSPLLHAGVISYSLYLLHIPIGGRLINLAVRLPDHLALKLVALAAATVVSIAASYFLWRWVERPALQWARRVPYHSTSPCSEISREPSQSGA